MRERRRFELWLALGVALAAVAVLFCYGPLMPETQVPLEEGTIPAPVEPPSISEVPEPVPVLLDVRLPEHTLLTIRLGSVASIGPLPAARPPASVSTETVAYLASCDLPLAAALGPGPSSVWDTELVYGSDADALLYSPPTTACETLLGLELERLRWRYGWASFREERPQGDWHLWSGDRGRAAFVLGADSTSGWTDAERHHASRYALEAVASSQSDQFDPDSAVDLALGLVVEEPEIGDFAVATIAFIPVQEMTLDSEHLAALEDLASSAAGEPYQFELAWQLTAATAASGDAEQARAWLEKTREAAASRCGDKKGLCERIYSRLDRAAEMLQSADPADEAWLSATRSLMYHCGRTEGVGTHAELTLELSYFTDWALTRRPTQQSFAECVESSLPGLGRPSSPQRVEVTVQAAAP